MSLVLCHTLKSKLKTDNRLYGIKLTNTNKHICSKCSSTETYIKIRNNRGSPVWYFLDNGDRVCSRCYNRLIVYPKHGKRHNKRLMDYRLDYCGINLLLSFPLPRDKCEVCSVTRKDRLIHRHHYFYCIIMPWACTISICNSCHSKITNKERSRIPIPDRTCLICKKIGSYKKINYKHKQGYICHTCYSRISKNK